MDAGEVAWMPLLFSFLLIYFSIICHAVDASSMVSWPLFMCDYTAVVWLEQDEAMTCVCDATSTETLGQVVFEVMVRPLKPLLRLALRGRRDGGEEDNRILLRDWNIDVHTTFFLEMSNAINKSYTQVT
jgi:hypothetical protein